MSSKVAASRSVRLGSFIASNPKLAEERKVFTIVSGANTERSRKKRKLSEDPIPKKEHYIKSIKNILKGFNQRKKAPKPSVKKSPSKTGIEEPKLTIDSAVIDQLSELRMEAANVSARLNNQLFQLKKQLCTSSLQLTDFYDRLIEVINKAKSQHKALIEGSQASLTDHLSKYLQKTEANLDVLDSLLEVFSKEAKVNVSDLPVLADIVQQTRLPHLHLEFASVYKQLDYSLQDRLSKEITGAVTLSDFKVYSQSFETLNQIADNVMVSFGWDAQPLQTLPEYVSNTGSADSKHRDRSQIATNTDRKSPRIRVPDLSEPGKAYKGSFHLQTYSLTRDKHFSSEDLNSNFNYKTARPPTGH